MGEGGGEEKGDASREESRSEGLETREHGISGELQVVSRG